MPEARLTEIGRSDADRIVGRESAAGAVVFTFETPGVIDRDAFFDVARRTFPLDPPLGTSRSVWDALADSLFGGLSITDSTRIVIVWLDSSDFRAGAPEEFEIALGVFRQVAADIAEPRFTNGTPKDLRVFVA